YTDRRTSNGYTSNNATVIIDVVGFTDTLTDAYDPNNFIDEVLGIFYAIDATSGLKAQLLSILLSGQASTSYWTTAWDDYKTDITNLTYYNIVNTRLKS